MFVPGQPRPDRALARTRPGCSSCSGSATRRTASRSASTGSGARRAARGSIFDDLEGVGPARRRALLQHFGSAERLLAATPGGARGRARACRRRPRARSTRSCTRPAGPRAAARCRRGPPAAALRADRRSRDFGAVLRRQRRVGERARWFQNLAAALFVYRRDALARSSLGVLDVLELRAGAAARAVDRERRPTGSTAARLVARDADRGERARRAARGARRGRGSRPSGSVMLCALALGVGERVRDAGGVRADRRPRAARGARLGGRAQLDDVQPRAGGRPGARRGHGRAARDRGGVRDQLGLVPRARRRRARRATRRAAATSRAASRGCATA